MPNHLNTTRKVFASEFRARFPYFRFTATSPELENFLMLNKGEKIFAWEKDEAATLLLYPFFEHNPKCFSIRLGWLLENHPSNYSPSGIPNTYRQHDYKEYHVNPGVIDLDEVAQKANIIRHLTKKCYRWFTFLDPEKHDGSIPSILIYDNIPHSNSDEFKHNCRIVIEDCLEAIELIAIPYFIELVSASK